MAFTKEQRLAKTIDMLSRINLDEKNRGDILVPLGFCSDQIKKLIIHIENLQYIEKLRKKDVAFACWEMLSLFAGGGSFQNEVVQIEFHEGEDEKEFRLWWDKHYVIIREYYEKDEDDGRRYSILSNDEDGFVYVEDEKVYDFLFSVFA